VDVVPLAPVYVFAKVVGGPLPSQTIPILRVFPIRVCTAVSHRPPNPVLRLPLAQYRLPFPSASAAPPVSHFHAYTHLHRVPLQSRGPIVVDLSMLARRPDLNTPFAINRRATPLGTIALIPPPSHFSELSLLPSSPIYPLPHNPGLFRCPPQSWISSFARTTQQLSLLAEQPFTRVSSTPFPRRAQTIDSHTSHAPTLTQVSSPRRLFLETL